jgi:glycosyltransferase involved in cell wall biosynthesis
MRVSVLSHGFANWGGGIDFIRYISSALALAQTDTDDKLDLQLVLPGHDLEGVARRWLGPTWRKIKSLKSGRRPTSAGQASFPPSYYRQTFADFAGDFSIHDGGSSFRSQLACAERFHPDVILPCMEVPKQGFKQPWLGYLYDFQHKHLPHFFSEQERRDRDVSFERMLSSAEHIIVNSHAVASDAKHFFGSFSSRLHVLPFSPCPQIAWLTQGQVKPATAPAKPYFIVCNQFWRHKDHATAFKAFARYVQQGGQADLVCTGQTSDYRFPTHAHELRQLIEQLGVSQRVHVLGHVPKLEQIALLRHAVRGRARRRGSLRCCGFGCSCHCVGYPC